MNKEEQKIEDVIIFLDASETHVLGVFGDEVHLQTWGFTMSDDPNDDTFECILIIPRTTYLNQWNKWLDGKKSICSSYNEYCGVSGTVVAIDPVLTGGKKTLNIWNEEKEDTEPKEFVVYKATEFDGEPDFEHG